MEHGGDCPRLLPAPDVLFSNLLDPEGACLAHPLQPLSQFSPRAHAAPSHSSREWRRPSHSTETAPPHRWGICPCYLFLYLCLISSPACPLPRWRGDGLWERVLSLCFSGWEKEGRLLLLPPSSCEAAPKSEWGILESEMQSQLCCY